MASIWTPTELDEQIAAYKAASLACAGGQSYRIGTRELTRADLPEIRAHLSYLAEEKDRLNGVPPLAGVRVRPRR